MKRTLCLAGLLVAAASSFAQGSGPKGYYMTAGDQQTNVRYDGGSVLTWSTSGGRDYPIAVAGDVRTAASGQFSGDHGGLYDLDGNYLGIDYKDFPEDPNQDMLFYDGATDGSRHFVVNYGNKGGVWTTDRNWQNITPLFSLGGIGDRLGITYDIENKSLWVSGWSNGMVEEYDLAGNFLSSFDSGLGGSITSLAMDYTTGILWMGTQNNQGLFNGYNRNGDLVDRFFDNTLASLNTLGGEFNVVPEPATMLGLGAGLAAIVRRRRNK